MRDTKQNEIMNNKKAPLWKKLKPHYSRDIKEDGTMVEIWAKKNPLGNVIAWVREITNPFGEKSTETVKGIEPDFGHYQNL